MNAQGGQWWLAALGRHIAWARLRVREAGTAEVLDSDGNTLAYDSEDTARAALLDAEFVEYDGLDEEDVQPPRGDDPEALRKQMFVRLGGKD